MIVKAFAEGFESQSRNGLATVVVQNTGFVTADFYVSKDYTFMEHVLAASQYLVNVSLLSYTLFSNQGKLGILFKWYKSRT